MFRKYLCAFTRLIPFQGQVALVDLLLEHRVMALMEISSEGACHVTAIPNRQAIPILGRPTRHPHAILAQARPFADGEV